MLKHLKNNTSPAQYSMAGIQINNSGQINLLEGAMTKSIESISN